MVCLFLRVGLASDDGAEEEVQVEETIGVELRLGDMCWLRRPDIRNRLVEVCKEDSRPPNSRMGGVSSVHSAASMDAGADNMRA